MSCTHVGTLNVYKTKSSNPIAPIWHDLCPLYVYFKTVLHCVLRVLRKPSESSAHPQEKYGLCAHVREMELRHENYRDSRNSSICIGSQIHKIHDFYSIRSDHKNLSQRATDWTVQRACCAWCIIPSISIHYGAKILNVWMWVSSYLRTCFFICIDITYDIVIYMTGKFSPSIYLRFPYLSSVELIIKQKKMLHVTKLIN